MTQKLYRFHFEGTGGDGSAWAAEGEVMCEAHDAFDFAMHDTFAQLTAGKAVYGKPGQGGCRGPYTISRMVIDLVMS